MLYVADKFCYVLYFFTCPFGSLLRGQVSSYKQPHKLLLTSCSVFTVYLLFLYLVCLHPLFQRVLRVVAPIWEFRWPFIFHSVATIPGNIYEFYRLWTVPVAHSKRPYYPNVLALYNSFFVWENSFLNSEFGFKLCPFHTIFLDCIVISQYL